jgi:D-3-phosphoglycerate dehydrogenase
MDLAISLGRIAAQLVEGKVLEIRIEAKGELAKTDTEPLVLAVVKGVLSCSIEGVNFVNAPVVAKTRNVKIVESKSSDTSDYVEELKVIVKTDKGEKLIGGTLLANNVSAVIQMDDYAMSATLAEHMLVTHHTDKPGMVAQVSTILWKENVNISSMHVGREGPRKMSVMILNLDDPIPAEVVKKVGQVEGVLEAKYVTLKG